MHYRPIQTLVKLREKTSHIVPSLRHVLLLATTSGAWCGVPGVCSCRSTWVYSRGTGPGAPSPLAPSLATISHLLASCCL